MSKKNQQPLLDESYRNAGEITAPSRGRIFPAIIAGSISGIATVALGLYFLRPFLIPQPPIVPPTTNEETNAQTVSSVTPLIQKTVLPDAISKAENAVVHLYRNSKNNLLSPDDHWGVGVAVTSDGWIAVAEDTMINAPADLLIVSRGTENTIAKKITDPFTHTVFIKINRTDLQVVPFGADATKGSAVSFIDRTGSTSFGFLTAAAKHTTTVPGSSEVLDLGVTTSPSTEAGTLIFNTDGALIGITGKTGFSAPGVMVGEATKLLLKNGSFTRSKLGINFLDLSALVVRNKRLPTDGALVVKKGATPAVAKKSPADLAGLKEGDVITMIDTVRVNADHSLPEILSLYAPKTSVPLTLWREGAVRTVTVTLE